MTSTLRSSTVSDILRRLGAEGHRSFFAAPTLWVALANHADFGRQDLSPQLLSSQARECLAGF